MRPGMMNWFAADAGGVMAWVLPGAAHRRCWCAAGSWLLLGGGIAGFAVAQVFLGAAVLACTGQPAARWWLIACLSLMIVAMTWLTVSIMARAVRASRRPGATARLARLAALALGLGLLEAAAGVVLWAVTLILVGGLV
jgi:hypothetical protein